MTTPTSTPHKASLRRDWAKFTALTFLFSFGFAIYAGVFQNFLRDILEAGPLQLGSLESLREIPGLLAALMAGTLVALAESRIAGFGLLIAEILGVNQVPEIGPFRYGLANQVIGPLLDPLRLGRLLLAVDFVLRAVGPLPPSEESILLDQLVNFGDDLFRLGLPPGHNRVDLVQFGHRETPKNNEDESIPTLFAEGGFARFSARRRRIAPRR